MNRTARFLLHPLAIAVWPLLLGNLGYVAAYFVAGHPQAGQVLPLAGLLLGGGLTLIHAAILLVLWARRVRAGTRA